MPGRNVFTVLTETEKQLGNAPALYQPKRGKKGEYDVHSWSDWVRTSTEIAAGLASLGIRKGEIACILSETRAEFYFVDLGIMGAGGVSGALYTAYPVAELAANVESCSPRFLFVEDEKTLESLAKAIHDRGNELPEHVILMLDGQSDLPSLSSLRQAGRDALQNAPKLFENLQENISPSDPAILYLTSGATGQPKMGMTSHRAVIANLDMGPIVLPITPEDSTVVFLPSAHIAQRIVLELVPMRMGTPVWFSESLSRLPSDLKTVRPTVFLAPPRVWERMYSTIQTEVRKRPAYAQKLFDAAVRLGTKAAGIRQSGGSIPVWMGPLLKAADKVVFSTVRQRLGGRIRIAASGAAPLGRQLAEFFAAIGMPLIEGYGLTEAGILSFNPIANPRPGSIGKLLPGVQAKLAEDGELLIKSPCMFQGYYQDEAATRSVLDRDGWFSTGDIAEVDGEGYWYITGRKKELIVSSNGKKIYPSRIENLFKMEPVVNHVLLIGDNRPYITAVLTLNMPQAESLSASANRQTSDPAAIVNSEPVKAAVQEAVSRVNAQLPEFERIRKFRILDREFSIEHGELTPTMKLRRSRALENHKALLTELYPGREDSE
ncbi:MAG: AMP-dependent synthetase/ligase [Bryobacteraceae bacterium]